MYESPIDVFVTQLTTKRREFEEKRILEAVQGVGVNINKHELEKALRYDREQYRKGYVDGIKEFAVKVAIELAANYSDEYCHWIDDTIDNLVRRMVGEG